MAELAALDLLLLAAIKAAADEPHAVVDIALGTPKQDKAAKDRLVIAELIKRQDDQGASRIPWRVTEAGDRLLAALRREMAGQSGRG